MDFTPRTRQLVWRIGATIAVIVLFITGLLAIAVVTARMDALAQAQLKTSYLSAAFAEDAEGGLNAVAVASDLVKNRVEADGHAVPLTELRLEISKYIPQLQNISLIGADGRLLATSGDAASLPANFSQFEFFAANRDSPVSGFRVGKPLQAPWSQQVIIPQTQRLQTKDGSFAGIILFATDPVKGMATYPQVDVGNSGSLMIIGIDGTIFAGYTLPRGLDPAILGTTSTIVGIPRNSPKATGSFTATSPIDGIERVYSWRRLKEFPLFALVGLGKAETLASANRQAVLMSGLGLVSVGLVLALTAMLLREISRRSRQALTVEAQRQKLKEINSELVTAKQQAEQANQSKSLFLAKVGHELRTPLNAILGFAQIIRDKIIDNNRERYSAYASDIYKAASHLLELIENLLDLSRIEAGKFELDETTVDLSQTEAQCVSLVRGQAENRGVELSIMEDGAKLSLMAGETALREIILNVLSNAIKFTPKGGSIWLNHRLDPDGALTVTVKDSGIGMTEDEIRLALEPFRQVRSGLWRRGEGLGLGLPIAVQLMELHGGALTIGSVPEQGTTVSLYFPAWRVNPQSNLEDYAAQEDKPPLQDLPRSVKTG
jgi:two-component system cell cycle sensor histidine kinase PleC